MRSAGIAAYCDVILAGNHDMSNDATLRGSLDVLTELLEDAVIPKQGDMSKPSYFALEFEGMATCWIPHHATQQLFDEAIDKVIESGGKWRAIFLHCNYENPHTEGHDISLNLTKAQAQALLEISDYVFLGHEHQPRELMKGRLVIMGNTFPTSFADISDKYYYDLTPTGLTKTKLWDMQENYKVIKYDANKIPKIPKADFIDIQGEITPEQGADLAEYISQCWETSGALMIRNSTSVVAETDLAAQKLLEGDIQSLPDRISEQLAGTDMEGLWNHYRGVIQC